MNVMFRPKIGLALGAGGPKGFAHIGVIKALKAHNIPIDYIAGTSAGALIGGMYCVSGDISSLEAYIIERNNLEMASYFSDFSLQSGVLQGNRVETFVEKYIGNASFSQTKTPFRAVAVDLKTAEKVELKNGSIAKAIRASIAIPMLFKPVEIEGRMLIDGGLSSPVPVETAFAMGADIVIAVQLDYWYRPTFDMQRLNPFQVGEMSLDIIEKKITTQEIKRAHVVLRPHLGSVHWSSFLNEAEKRQCITEGEKEAERAMVGIQSAVQTNRLRYLLNKFFHRFL